MRSIMLMFCFGPVLLFSGFLTGQTARRERERSAPIRVNVDMVSLPVVVTNREGRRITDLKPDDFQVFENGVRQEIAGFAATDEPVSVALLLDTSGSTERKLAKIQSAAIDFVNQLHPDDEVAVISFADDVRLQQDFSIDRNKNEYGIKKTRPGGSTVLYEAVWVALEEVLKPINERKALVLFTDGVDEYSRKASERETLELARETRATIYCVYYNTQRERGYSRPGGIGGRYPAPFPPVILDPWPPVQGGPDPSTNERYIRGREYLSKLAEYSGGLVFDGEEDLRDAFQQVARELASQYSIGYYSNAPKNDGKFRKIEVKVNKPGLVARTRKGYFAKKG